MSEITEELARVRGAFDKPTLRLVEQKWAPIILAVFRSSFPSQRKAIPAEQLHTQVDTYLGDLRLSGQAVPEGTGRELCLYWMHQQWLVRETDPEGGERYRLTSHAHEALGLVESLTRGRALISESRLSMILADVHKWATEANPDRDARIADLDIRIAELTAERDRLAGGGDLTTATDDQMLDGYSNLIDLISQLPGDFARVSEEMKAMRQRILADFRAEDRPIGEVIDDYLRRSDELMTATSEGRAFEGAFALLRDDAMLADLHRDLHAIVSHPFSEALTGAERRTFTGAVAIISEGIKDVLDERRRLTTTLRDYIVRHDPGSDRELDVLLREITNELAMWMETAGPNAKVPVRLTPPERTRFMHVRERLSDSADEAPPPPLRDHSTEPVERISLEELRHQGGPNLNDLAIAIDLARVDSSPSLAEVFNTLEDRLRRPVEILGLHQLAHRFDDTRHDTQTPERFTAIRPDGSTRVFCGPRIQLPAAQTAAPTQGREPGDD